MLAVHFDSVSFSYTSAVDIVTDASMSFGPGWHGLVGENGSGKTTLLRLATGELAPISGRVTFEPGDAIVGGCPQVVDRLDPRIEDFAASWEKADGALRSRLQLDENDLARWSDLSPGERRRWQMATVLAVRPDILCVDEPTNHLDGEASSLIIAELGRFRGVGLIVSHDRRLLDQLTTSTLRIDRGSVRRWSGSYTAARREWTEEEAATLERVDTLKRERDRIQRRLEQRRREVREIGQRDRARRRRAGPSDPDARSISIKNRQSNAEAAQSGATGKDAERLGRIEERLGDVALTRKRGGPISIDSASPGRRVLLSHRGDLVAGGATVLHRDLSVYVERDTLLRITGGNGSGKTTLIESLLTDPPIPSDRVLFLPQELSRAQRVQVLRRIDQLGQEEKGEVMALAARLGADPRRLLHSDLPSPGEARKLWLAEGLGRRVWVAVLDEPTNHFDLPAIERLEEALAGYRQALVLVTHDDAFAAAVTDSEMRLDQPRPPVQEASLQPVDTLAAMIQEDDS